MVMRLTGFNFLSIVAPDAFNPVLYNSDFKCITWKNLGENKSRDGITDLKMLISHSVLNS